MKMLLAVTLLLGVAAPSHAQAVAAPAIAPVAPAGDLTLGGVPKLIAQKIQEAKAAGLVDFAGHIGGGGYVPTWSFHDMDGRIYVEAANIGYRAIDKSKPSVFLMPLTVNLTALSARAWNFDWANKHVTRSVYPDVFLGVGALVPLDSAQVKQLLLRQPKDWLAACASVRL